MIDVPRDTEAHAIPVGGPRHYPVKTCVERGFHVVRKIESAFSTLATCQHCGQTGDHNWARSEIQKEGDFLLELGKEIEGLYADAPVGVYARKDGLYAGGKDQ